MGTRRRFILISLILAGVALLGAGRASADLDLKQRCIAAGLVLPEYERGYTFNHHPEKDREVRSTDNFLAPFEVATEFEAVVADMPAACRGRFTRTGQVKLQFKSTKGGKGWRSIYKGWEEMGWGARYLDPPKPTLTERTVTESIGIEPPPSPAPPEYAVEESPASHGTITRTIREYGPTDPPPSPFVAIASRQNIGALGLGCATASRARFKFAIVDDATKEIVAVRLFAIPIPVDSWAQARCQGKFSIQDSGAAPRCGKRVVGGRPGGPPLIWGVKVQRVGCARAAAIGQAALQVPAFSQGSIGSHRVAGWTCYFGFRGAFACLQGSKRVFLIARKGVRERCAGAPRGIKGLSVSATSCGVAIGVASQIQGKAEKGTLETLEAGGSAWSCPALRYLDSDDRAILSYHCFAGAAMVAFEVAASPNRIVPPEPTAIPPEVILPGSGPAALFALTPEMKFGERAKYTRTKVLVPVEVEPALVGRKAHLELVEFKAECSWTADQGQTSPICTDSRRVGASRKTIVLRARQMLYLAPRKHRGNWLYRLTIETRPFTSGGLSYRRTSHALSASVINEAENCEINPWCKPGKKKGSKSRGFAGPVLQLR